MVEYIRSYIQDMPPYQPILPLDVLSAELPVKTKSKDLPVCTVGSFRTF